PVRMLVLTPTRELADQIDQNVQSYIKNLPLRHTVLFGGMNMDKQTADLRAGNPQTQNIPNELNQTLKELRTTLQGVSPQSPIYGDVQNTLQSLDKTLKDVQPVINTL
ncbi:DEAD/DEAH box helicase, partial [Klebsiella pneumoniae]|nr:DEAD/DEAH box helicase [Klebsiella pneumoniae]